MRAASATPSVALGPVHIGGLERSGKTTMQAFLTSHPRIAIPHVGSNMWTYFYRRYGRLTRRDNFERCLSAMLAYDHIASLEPDPARIRQEFRRGPQTYARLFALFLSHYAERNGKPRWGVQTGLIERYADEIFDAYPGAKIIHMVRDPRDRYEASLSLWPNGKGRAGGATARWNYSLGLAKRNVRRHPDRYLIIRFEDLVLDTEGTLRAVCSFLGERFVPEMLAMTGAPERRDTLLARAAATGHSGVLSPTFVGHFRDRLDPAEVRFIQRHTHRGMHLLGYPDARLHMSSMARLRFAGLDWPSQFARLVAWRGIELIHETFPRRMPRPRPGARVLKPAGDGA